jgi:hypothetical protein
MGIAATAGLRMLDKGFRRVAEKNNCGLYQGGIIMLRKLIAIIFFVRVVLPLLNLLNVGMLAHVNIGAQAAKDAEVVDRLAANMPVTL